MKQDPRTILTDEQIFGRLPTIVTRTNETIPTFHWVPDKPDNRDYIYQISVPKTPQSVDLRTYATPVEDQGQLGSCTGNAIAEAIELLNRKANKPTEISRLFIYYEERVLEGTVNEDAGAYIRDGIKVVNKKGAPLESLWPYIENKVLVKPVQLAYTNALTRRALNYQRCLNFTAVRAAIAAGYPVVVGFTVYESFESGTWWYPNGTGLMPYPDANIEDILGGHAVCLVGYNDNSRTFIARNSWGTSWGKRGYFYMPYQVIQDTDMSDDFWIITSISNP